MSTVSAPETRVPTMPSRSGLVVRTLVALVIAAVILVCFILPAEYHIDPTHIGRATGLMQISEPPKVDNTAASTQLAAEPVSANTTMARNYPVAFRTDEIKIPLRGDEELEYKVKMAPGGTLVYSWSTSKGMVYYDFHGERPEDPKHATSYGMGVEKALNGSLIAPFAGIHGWFLQNQEGEPIVVTLKMSGFYELRDNKIKTLP
jgi:hypothetical protein